MAGNVLRAHGAPEHTTLIRGPGFEPQRAHTKIKNLARYKAPSSRLGIPVCTHHAHSRGVAMLSAVDIVGRVLLVVVFVATLSAEKPLR